MAYSSLKSYLKDWYRAHHFYMMPPAKRAQWLDMMGEDDYDVVTEDTQETFRDLMQSATAVPPPAYDKDITIHAGNIDRIRAISGLPNFDDLYKPGDMYRYNVNNAATRDTYLRVFSPKLGDRFYYNDVRSGGQKSWGDKKSGLLLDRPYPDIKDLSDAEIERFYTIVRTTLRNISDNKPEFPDPDNPPKVANFLGAGKAFEEFAIKADGNADKKLKQFAKVASADPILMETLRNHLASRFGADYTVDTFIADLAEGKIRARALNRVPTLMAVLKEWNSVYSTIDSSIKTKVMNVFGNSDDMDDIIRETDQESERIDPVKLAQFKNPRVYSELLSSMYDTSKEGKQSAFYSDFEKNGGSEITKPMTLIVNNYNYDKMDGKYKDKLTFVQQLKKDFGDWKDDHITKLWKRALRHNYVEPNAKLVVDAICKLEIDPTKGLKEILAKKADIKKILSQKPAGEKGFDFLCEVLEKIQVPMKKAFAGALKNGAQAEAIAKEIIKAAISHQPPKMGEARVALETLAVMRYDIFSAARGKEMTKAINSANFFDGASFMKQPAVAFVINAAQKTFNLGVNGAFWACVMGRNLIQAHRGKISDEDAKKLSEAMDKIQSNADKFSTYESAGEELQTAQDNYNAFETAHDAAITAAGFPPGTADRLQKYMDKLQSDLDRDEQEYNEKLEKLQADTPRVKGRYAGFQTEAHAWNAAVAAGTVPPAVTAEFLDEFNLWKSGLTPFELGDGSAQHLMPLFEAMCAARATGMAPAVKAAMITDVVTRHHSIRAQKAVLDGIKMPYIQLKAELNVAQDVFNFQKKKRLDRAETKTEHNPGDAPLSDKQNAYTLSWFWNACNGYDFGLNINDFNFLKKHENQSQKLQFNAMAAQRLRDEDIR